MITRRCVTSLQSGRCVYQQQAYKKKKNATMAINLKCWQEKNQLLLGADRLARPVAPAAAVSR